MSRFCVRAALAILTGLSAPFVSAADSDWYAGLGLGYAKATFFSDFSRNNAAIAESMRRGDASFKGYIGYRLNRYWAIEGEYIQLGKFEYIYRDAGCGCSGELNYKVTGTSINLIPMLPLGSTMSIFGRLGMFNSHVTASVPRLSDTIPPQIGLAAGATPNANNVSPLVGFGLQFELGEDSGMRLEYENYGKVGNELDTGRAKVQGGSFSLYMKF